MEKSGGDVMGGAGSTNNSLSIEIEGNVQAARRNSHYHAKGSRRLIRLIRRAPQ
jgi:hypothetical protein